MNEFILPVGTKFKVQTHTVCATQVDKNKHGRPQKFFQGGKRRNFAYHFLVADDAT